MNLQDCCKPKNGLQQSFLLRKNGVNLKGNSRNFILKVI